MTLHPGDLLDHFELESLVATSGMATVFRAKDVRTGELVAIKVPHPEIESDPTMFDRFRREEEIGTRIEHPGVMKVYANPERSQVYMVMEWLDGKLLRQIGADVVAACFIIDLPDLGGAAKLRAMNVPVITLMAFEGH